MPSSFFPHNWTEQNVVRAVQEAYDSSRSIPGKSQKYREGRSANGVTIGMYLNSDGKLSTAFPTAPHAAIAVHGNGEAIPKSAAEVPWGDW